MKFKYYFLKQGDRLYDKTELITLLSNHIYITPPDKKDPYGNTVYAFFS